ncbi:MAG: TIGR03435 family protein [Bryobacteraceae bacterium]|jgi:uncharacterized protein (TIGR03435 family)
MKLVILVWLALACSAAHAQTAAPIPEFEVASVKPSPPDAWKSVKTGCTGGPGTSDPGLLTCRNLTLLNYLMVAYDIRRREYSGPDWIETAQFDIDAKLPPGTDMAQCRLMIQSLLKDRFRLAAHREERSMAVYELAVPKGGMKLKSPAAGSEAKGGPISLKPQPHEGWHLQMANQTMRVFVDMLTPHLRLPIVDATGLTGRYDFDLTWTDLPSSPERPPSSDAPLDAPAPSLLVAVEDQLGLRLVQKNGPVTMLVIDHIEKTPTEN